MKRLQETLNTAKVYGPFILFIICWWTLAFRKGDIGPRHETSLENTLSDTSSATSPYYDDKLTPLNRDEIKKALAGDFSLMAKLIADWDIDAQLLEIKRYADIKKLPPGDYLRSQTLIRLINGNTPVPVPPRERITSAMLIDDSGSRIDLSHPYRRFIPQTYAAASFLLALVPPNQILALPPLLREQTQIYPKELTDKIPLDIDRRNSEKLFLANPDIAFVAHYSQPATIQTLANQGIVIYMMKDLLTLDAIGEELRNIGAVIQRPLQADLMKLFIEAAFLALDNRLALIRHHYAQRGETEPHFMMLSYHQGFWVPTSKTLTGQILARMTPFDRSLLYSSGNDSLGDWSKPIDKEKLLNNDPDILIIAADNGSDIVEEFYSDSALSKLRAVRNSRLFIVDEAIQNSPTQYAVLAYLDLIKTLEPPP